MHRLRLLVRWLLLHPLPHGHGLVHLLLQLLLLRLLPGISRWSELPRSSLLDRRRVASLVALIHATCHAGAILMLHLLLRLLEMLLLLRLRRLLMRLNILPLLLGLLAPLIKLMPVGHAIAIHDILLISGVELLLLLRLLLLLHPVHLLMLLLLRLVAVRILAATTVHLLLSLAGIALAGRERALLVCHDVEDMDGPTWHQDGDDETMQQSLMPPPPSRVIGLGRGEERGKRSSFRQKKDLFWLVSGRVRCRTRRVVVLRAGGRIGAGGG